MNISKVLPSEYNPEMSTVLYNGVRARTRLIIASS